jgi:hypothetical protein
MNIAIYWHILAYILNIAILAYIFLLKSPSWYIEVLTLNTFCLNTIILKCLFEYCFPAHLSGFQIIAVIMAALLQQSIHFSNPYRIAFNFTFLNVTICFLIFAASPFALL